MGTYDRLQNVTRPTPATPFGCSLFATNDAADPLFRAAPAQHRLLRRAAPRYLVADATGAPRP